MAHRLDLGKSVVYRTQTSPISDFLTPPCFFSLEQFDAPRNQRDGTTGRVVVWVWPNKHRGDSSLTLIPPRCHSPPHDIVVGSSSRWRLFLEAPTFWASAIAQSGLPGLAGHDAFRYLQNVRHETTQGGCILRLEYELTPFADVCRSLSHLSFVVIDGEVQKWKGCGAPASKNDDSFVSMFTSSTFAPVDSLVRDFASVCLRMIPEAEQYAGQVRRVEAAIRMVLDADPGAVDRDVTASLPTDLTKRVSYFGFYGPIRFPLSSQMQLLS